MIPKLFFGLLAIFLFSGEVQARRVTVGIPSPTVPMIAFYVAKDKGFYREEELEVELVVMRAPIANQALIAGSIQFSTIQLAGLIAALRGVPLKVIFGSFNRPLFWLYAKPTITGIKDLKGKKVGTCGPGCAPDVLVREFLEAQGLLGDRDVPVLNVGDSPTRLAALQSGALDASMFTLPDNFKAEELGFREIANFVEQDMVQLYGSIVVRDAFLKSEPELVKKFVRASLKGLLYAQNNRAGTIPVIIRNMKLQGRLAERSYDIARPAMIDGVLREDHQSRFLEFVIKSQGLKEIPSSERHLGKFFNFSVTQRIRNELSANQWKPD
jgi:ABC-type nitrate/sulfonate/bicarbonate transport system substrate-binding protein